MTRRSSSAGQVIFLLVSRMTVETTTDDDYYYDYDSNETDDHYYYNYNDTYILCSLKPGNYLEAHLAPLYYCMFVFSLSGNGLVLVIIRRFEKLTTVTNILLLNLVLSSVIFMSSLPFLGVYMQLSTWIFGEAMCKTVGSVYYLGYYSSVLFLTLLTFDRHLAVVYSLRAAHVRNRRYAVISCGVVWLVSGLACIRPMILHTTYVDIDNNTYCNENPNNLTKMDLDQHATSGFYLQLFLFLIFPLAVIIYCYVRIAITVMSSKIVTKFKTVRLIFVIVLLLFICWIPFNVVMLMYDEATGCEEAENLDYALEITRNNAHIYFCISPIFYTFVGKKFRNYFRQLLVKRFPSLRRHISVSEHSRNNVATESTLDGR